MKTLVKSLIVITGLLIVAGCEDDRIFPSPQKYVESPATVTVPFISEFTTTFTKSLVDSLHVNDYGFDVFWNLWFMSNGIMEYPYYFLEQTGNGTAAGLGDFTIIIDSWWSSVDGRGFTSAEITTGGGDILYVNIQNSNFSSEFPYDQTNYDLSFTAGGGLGKYMHCSGSGTITLNLSESSSKVIAHKWLGNLKLVKRK
jgi:hypothetical protein